MDPIVEVVAGPILDIADEAGVVVARGYLDVDSTILHSLASLVQLQEGGTVVGEAVLVVPEGVFGNLSMLVLTDWRRALRSLCMKLVKPNCTVYRISSNRHHVDYSGRSSCILYSGLICQSMGYLAAQCD